MKYSVQTAFVSMIVISSATLSAQSVRSLSAAPLSPEIPIYLDSNAPLEQRVKDALSRMTLEEKCRLAYAQSKFSSPGVPRLGIPDLWYSDGPHGVRAEINWNNWGYADWTNDSITAYPALTCLAATWNIDLAHQYGVSVGEEARMRKKSVLLGPGVNIYRTPLNGRNFEYMGEDPYLASRMVIPYIQGVQQNGVGACVKHYVLNDQEEFRGHVDVKVSDRALNEIYLPPFKAAVEEAGVWSLMGSYNQYLNQHVSHNEVLLDNILKHEWDFDGVVVSDWGAVHDTEEAAMNGLDSEMGSFTNGLTSEGKGFGYDDYYLGKAYLRMCQNGEVPDSVINDKAGRILRLLFRTEKSQNLRAPQGRIGSEEQLAVARQIATEGIVLLKNDPVVSANKQIKSSPLLPILPSRYQRILVVGENATRSLCMGGGSSELKTKVEVAPLQGLLERFGKEVQIDYAQGYKSGGAHYGAIDVIDPAVNTALRREAVDKARQADLVIYVGGLNKNHFSDCEGGDRLTYDLDYGQNDLINALLDVNPRMVCVIISGNAFRMPWLNRVPALVQSWYLGSMAGAALADVLSGDVCPSGKTVFSYPRELINCPAHQLGRVGYPGVSPSEMPAAYNFGDKNPKSAQLLSVATKSSLEQGLVAKKSFSPSLMVLNDSTDPASHAGKGDETVVYSEDILVGYRWYDYHGLNAVQGKQLAFPFGYGLSYTTFRYSDFTVYGNAVAVNITNTGSVEGKETVQFYVGDDKSSVIRPRKELKYFEKVSLKPGETKSVTYTISDDDLRYYDENKKQWVLEPGNFTVYICASSVDVRGKVIITR